GDGVFMRRTNQRRAEIAGIMGIRHSDCGRRSELAKKRPQSGGDADQIMRGKSENRMLSRALRQSGKLIGRMRNSFCNLFWNRDSYLASVIKNDRVSVDHLKRSDRRIAFHAANRLLADPLDVGVRIECTAIRALGCGVRITQIMA